MDLNKNHWLATLVKSTLGWSESMAPCEKTFRDGGSSTRKRSEARPKLSFSRLGGIQLKLRRLVGWLVGWLCWLANQ